MIFLLEQPHALSAPSLGNHPCSMNGSTNSKEVQNLDDIERWIRGSPHLLHFRSTQRDTSMMLRTLPRSPLLLIEKGTRRGLTSLSLFGMMKEGASLETLLRQSLRYRRLVPRHVRLLGTPSIRKNFQ